MAFFLKLILKGDKDLFNNNKVAALIVIVIEVKVWESARARWDISQRSLADRGMFFPISTDER